MFDDRHIPVSGLFAWEGLPCYLETDGEANLFGQVELKLVSWYGPGDQEEGVWGYQSSLVVSGSLIRFFDDIAGWDSVPNRVFEIPTPQDLTDQFNEICGNEDSEKLRAWVCRVLAEVMTTQPLVFQPLAPEHGVDRGFEHSRWGQQMGIFTP